MRLQVYRIFPISHVGGHTSLEFGFKFCPSLKFVMVYTGQPAPHIVEETRLDIEMMNMIHKGIVNRVKTDQGLVALTFVQPAGIPLADPLPWMCRLA
jgi:hypothetical protein